MLKPESPCLGCDHRSVGCHSNCDGYTNYVEENAKYKKLIDECKRQEDIAFTLIEQQTERNNKKYKKGCPWK